MTEPLTIEQEQPQSNALVRLDDNPAYLMRRATDVAGVSRDIVMKTAITIQGRKYVKVEGWQAIAIAHGCIASSRDVERVETGHRAIGEVKRMSDGLVLATAEGFVGDDEVKTWGQRPEYAKRAMAQTRAISRACRSAFAHVVVLIDANLSTTPAEEVPDEGFSRPKAAPATTRASTPRPLSKTLTPAPPKPPPAPSGAAKPFKSKEVLIKLLERNRDAAEAILREEGVIGATETLENWPIEKLPINADQLNNFLQAVQDEVDNPGGGGESEDYTIHGSNEPWRSMVTPFAVGDIPKGTRFGDLPKNKLWWWCQKWQPKPFNGKVSESDALLRVALDGVDEKYFSDRKQEPELPMTDPNDDVPF